MEDFNKAVDEWVAQRNSHIGEVIIPKVGAVPPQLGIGHMERQMNEYVTTDLIRHYAEATGDRNPLWQNEEYAAKSVWGGIIAPPTLTDCIGVSWGQNPPGDVTFGLATLPGGSRRQWYDVMRPGDKFRLVDTCLGLTEKKSREPKPYRLFIDTWRRSYINQRDETVVEVDMRMTALATPARGPGGGGQSMFTGGDRKMHRLTDEERNALYRGYEEETRRGSEPLFWEDVEVGDELKPLVAGPLFTWDVATFMTAVSGYCLAFDIKYDWMKSEDPKIERAHLDPEINAHRIGGEVHLADNIGGQGGRAFGYGAQIEGLMCRSLYNWMGDAGFLKITDNQYRGMPLLGSVFHVNGEVINKSVEDGEHLVDVDVHTEDADGLNLVRGTSRVRLPSREVK